jgi:hypothetical protein
VSAPLRSLNATSLAGRERNRRCPVLKADLTQEVALNVNRFRVDAPSHRARVALLVLLAAMVGACAQVSPRVSHAHLGHALTAWHDTPDHKGFLVVARNLADTALREAESATRAAPQAARVHLANVADALSADSTAQPRPGAYGLMRALEGAIDHIEYAAASKDASQNLVVAAVEITAAAEFVIDGFRRALTLARSADELPPDRLRETALTLRRALEQAINGSDADADGRVALNQHEAGLVQIEQRLARAVAEETDPPYRPLPQNLLFGLIRLPDGQWRFKEQATTARSAHPAGCSAPGY